MKATSLPTVLHIVQFEDYNKCLHCGNSFYIRNFNKHIKENNFLDHPHSHDFFILLYITTGQGTHYIDFNSYEVQPGSFFFISPGQVHSWALPEEVDGYILFFSKEYFLLGAKDTNALSKLPFFYTHLNKPSMILPVEEAPKIQYLFESIIKEYVDREDYFHDVIRLNLNILLTLLERRYEGRHREISGLMRYQDNLLHKFESLIDQHYKMHWNVSAYAEAMNISLKQLNTICKKSIDKTPGELILARIVLEAKRLLLHSDHSVCTIAHLLNYSDDSYFIRLFKKYTSATPEQFRVNATGIIKEP